MTLSECPKLPLLSAFMAQTIRKSHCYLLRWPLASHTALHWYLQPRLEQHYACAKWSSHCVSFSRLCLEMLNCSCHQTSAIIAVWRTLTDGQLCYYLPHLISCVKLFWRGRDSLNFVARRIEQRCCLEYSLLWLAVDG